MNWEIVVSLIVALLIIDFAVFVLIAAGGAIYLTVKKFIEVHSK